MDDKGHKKILQEKENLYERFLKKRTKHIENEYKVYKIMFELLKHKSKKSYISQKINKCKDNVKEHGAF